MKERTFEILLANYAFHVRHYNIFGPMFLLYGFRSSWIMQFKTLISPDDEDARGFAKCVLGECKSTAITGALLAQVAFTSLGLDLLRQVHWTAKAFWVFSLLSAIMTVHLANKQIRIFGRLLHPDEIRSWILGTRKEISADGHSPPVRDPRSRPYTDEDFRPAITSVTVAFAPSFMLSMALLTFSIALGIYLCSIWQRHINVEVGPVDHSHAVFEVFAISICLFYGIYYFIIALQKTQELRFEEILRKNIDNWNSGRVTPGGEKQRNGVRQASSENFET